MDFMMCFFLYIWQTNFNGIWTLGIVIIILCFFGVLWEQIIAAAKDVQAKTEIYAPYNILPLDSAGASQSIMQLEEVYLL